MGYKRIIYKSTILIILFLFLLPFASAIEFTEIMYDPDGTDSSYEWIEIYSETPINISKWNFFENGEKHGLTLINGSWVIENYAVIAVKSEKFLEIYPDYNGTLIDSIFSLHNGGEYLALKNKSGTIITEIDYSFPIVTGTTKEGYSLEKIEIGLLNSTAKNWDFSLLKNGTPGRQNSLFNSCDWEISIFDTKNLWELENGTTVIKWKINVSNVKNNTGLVNFSYWVEGSSGKIVKPSIDKNTTISDIFGSPFSLTLHNPGGYILFANITSTNCFDYKLSNNLFRQPIVVTGVGEIGSSASLSSIKIKEVSPEEIKFGEIIKVELELYRGDTAKYSISLQVKDKNGKKVSEKSTIHLQDKLTSYELMIPIQLPEDCKYKSGDYSLELEGLGLEEKKEIEIEGSSCSEESNNNDNNLETSKKINKKFTYSLVNLPKEILSGEELNLNLELKNDEEEKNYFISSYLYNGKKCYSCKESTLERDHNQIKVKLKENEDKVIESYISIDDDIKAGKYKLKVIILEEGLKTAKEITEEIEIKEKIMEKKEPEENKEILLAESYSSSPYLNRQVIEASPGMVVYESNSYKSKKFIPILLFISFGLLFVLVRRK